MFEVSIEASRRESDRSSAVAVETGISDENSGVKVSGGVGVASPGELIWVRRVGTELNDEDEPEGTASSVLND